MKLSCLDNSILKDLHLHTGLIEGDGILVYARDDIASKLIEKNCSVESISIELNLRKKMWVINCTYNASNSNICDHLRNLGKSLETLPTNYDKVFLMGDFNVDEANIHIKDFCNLYKLKNLIKVPTCFKSPDNPKTINLILTNSVRSFQNSCALETGLFDFLKTTAIVLKSYLEKKQPKIISYRDFPSNHFRKQILLDFSTLHLSSDSPSLDLYVDICIRALDIYAPKNKKYLRANSSPFMNKAISKAVMNRARLRNKFLNNRSAENKLAYNLQRNYCASLTRQRGVITTILITRISLIAIFFGPVKLFVSDKGSIKQKITLIKNDKIIGNNTEISEIFNNFFSNIVAQLYIPKYEDLSVNSFNSEDPLQNLVTKYKNHPSIRAILN